MDADSERAKMIAGQHYLSDDAELLAARIKARQIVQRYGATDPAAADERQALLVSLAAQLGDDVVLEPPFHCDYGWNISLGAGSYINCNCVILDCAPVTIGALAQIGPSVMLCAAAHSTEPAQRARGLEYAQPIVLGSNVWVGAGVVIGPGVTIGDNSVIGAGSIVMRDVAANVVVAGNPCRVLRRL